MYMTSMIVTRKDILYNTDIIISIVKLIAPSPVGKLVYFYFYFYIFSCCLISPRCEQTQNKTLIDWLFVGLLVY